MQDRTWAARIVGWGLMSAWMLVGGCAPQESTAPPAEAAVAPNTTDPYASWKAAYLQANPDARVGRVEAVLPDQNRLAVGEIPVNEFQTGDILSIVDRNMNLVAEGTVTDIGSDLLYLRYTVGSSGVPAVGDIAIRPASPKHTVP